MAIPPPMPATHPQVRRNFRLNVMDGVTWTASMAFVSQSAILPLFVSSFTTERWVLGLIPAVAFAGSNVAQILGAAYTARQRHFWRTLCFQTTLPRIALALMCVAPWLPAGWALGCFFLAWGLFNAMAGFNAPAWFEFVGYVIDPARRGLFFGCRSAIGGVMSLAAATAAAWILARVGGPAGFGLCFLCALGFNVWSLSCVVRTRHDFAAAELHRAASPPFGEAARELARNLVLRRYILARCLIALTTGASAFYVVHGKEAFHLTEATSSLLAIALSQVPALTGVTLGRMADRHGNKTVQLPACLLGATGALALAGANTLPVYVAGLVLVGCATVAVNMLDSKWLLEIAPERAGVGLSFFNLVLAPVAVGASLAAGPLVQAYGAATLFVFCAAAWLMGVFAILGMQAPGVEPRVEASAA